MATQPQQHTNSSHQTQEDQPPAHPNNTPDTTFTLSAPSGSDIHASPSRSPSYILTAPTAYYHPTSTPLSSFRRARLELHYTPTLQYDHAGLVLILPDPASDPSLPPSAETASGQTAWVKAGLEAKDGRVYLSVVTKPRGGWCDWSLHAAGPPSAGAGMGAAVELVRAGHALLVNHVQAGGGAAATTMLRKVPWVFLDDHEGGASAWVGAFAARPDPEGRAGGERLVVGFRGFQVETA
ncbi:hypothetical protein TruAng_010517 [Truncatella angustata]|nr:hypothetical protein TruAng_010517 [Truncatella angustata]